ncbi:MAG: FtsW/RodA/SpoVE family cell cycle protein [Candidatus Omnitrophota bacterium]
MSKESGGIIIIVLTLIAIGIIMTYSASGIYADQVMGSPTYFLVRQISFFCIGIVFLVSFSLIDPGILQRNSRLIMLLAILLLLTVYLPFLGQTTRGTKRWLKIFGFNLQPAEFSKVALCIYFSDYLSRKTKQISRGSIVAFLPPLTVLCILSSLILIQPDLGTVVILFSLSAVLFFSFWHPPAIYLVFFPYVCVGVILCYY